VAGTWEIIWNRSLERESMSRRYKVRKGCLIKKKKKKFYWQFWTLVRAVQEHQKFFKRHHLFRNITLPCGGSGFCRGTCATTPFLIRQGRSRYTWLTRTSRISTEVAVKSFARLVDAASKLTRIQPRLGSRPP
jgi:hypothetical protein